MAGLLSGLGTALVLYVLWGEPGVPLAGAAAMIVPMVVLPVVSLLTGETSPSAVAETPGN